MYFLKCGSEDILPQISQITKPKSNSILSGLALYTLLWSLSNATFQSGGKYLSGPKSKLKLWKRGVDLCTKFLLFDGTLLPLPLKWKWCDVPLISVPSLSCHETFTSYIILFLGRYLLFTWTHFKQWNIVISCTYIRASQIFGISDTLFFVFYLMRES